MPQSKAVLSDPDFARLDEAARIRVLSRLDADFAALAKPRQRVVLQNLTVSPPPPEAATPNAEPAAEPVKRTGPQIEIEPAGPPRPRPLAPLAVVNPQISGQVESGAAPLFRGENELRGDFESFVESARTKPLLPFSDLTKNLPTPEEAEGITDNIARAAVGAIKGISEIAEAQTTLAGAAELASIVGGIGLLTKGARVAGAIGTASKLGLKAGGAALLGVGGKEAIEAGSRSKERFEAGDEEQGGRELAGALVSGTVALGGGALIGKGLRGRTAPSRKPKAQVQPAQPKPKLVPKPSQAAKPAKQKLQPKETKPDVIAPAQPKAQAKAQAKEVVGLSVRRQPVKSELPELRRMANIGDAIDLSFRGEVPSKAQLNSLFPDFPGGEGQKSIQVHRMRTPFLDGERGTKSIRIEFRGPGGEILDAPKGVEGRFGVKRGFSRGQSEPPVDAKPAQRGTLPPAQPAATPAQKKAMFAEASAAARRAGRPRSEIIEDVLRLEVEALTGQRSTKPLTRVEASRVIDRLKREGKAPPKEGVALKPVEPPLAAATEKVEPRRISQKELSESFAKLSGKPKAPPRVEELKGKVRNLTGGAATSRFLSSSTEVGKTSQGRIVYFDKKSEKLVSFLQNPRGEGGGVFEVESSTVQFKQSKLVASIAIKFGARVSVKRSPVVADAEAGSLQGTLRAPRKPGVVIESPSPAAKLAGDEAGVLRIPAIDPTRTGPKLQSRPGVAREAVDFFSPTRSRLGRIPTGGKEIKALIDKAADLGEVAAGKRFVRLEDTRLEKLGREQNFELLDQIEGRAQAPKGDTVFDTVRALTEELGDEALQLGVQARQGRKLRPFRKRQDFFPHTFADISTLAKRGKIREDVIENLQRRKIRPGRESAAQFLDEYINFLDEKGGRPDSLIRHLIDTGQAAGPAEAFRLLRVFRDRQRVKRQGSVEFSREINLPFYDPNPARVLPRFVVDASKRLKQIEVLGQNNQNINALMAKIPRADADFARKAVDRILDLTNEKPSRASSLLRNIQGFKLGLAGIPNSTQGTLNTMLAADFPAVAAGFRGMFSKRGRRLGVESGAALDSVVQEALRQLGGGATALSTYLRAVQFTRTERLNRVFAANAGANYAGRLLNRLTGKKKQFLPDSFSPSGGKSRARDMLAELGIDAAAAVKRGKLSPDDILIAAKKFSDLTQFRSRPQDLPLFASSNAGKVFFQFKTFIYNQTRLIGKETIGEFRVGRFGRGTRGLIVLGVLFPMAGEVTQDLRSLIKGRPRPTDPFARYLDNIGASGALGVLEGLQSGVYGEGASFIAGPTVGTAGDIIEFTARQLTDDPKKRPSKAQRTLQFAVRQFPEPAKSITRRLTPRKKKRRRTDPALKSLLK